MEGVETASNERPHDMCFQVRRIFLFLIVAILYALVFFQRTCPSIVSTEMALDYNKTTSDLSIFSSIFFYPYGIVQPFAGLLADIIEPSYVIGIMQIIASIGTIVCGASGNIGVGCAARFFCGLGCGPTYVPVCRIILAWFPQKNYAIMVGILLAFGGVGSIIAQAPLAQLATSIGWRGSFYLIGGINLFFSILCLIFVRGNPTKLNYLPVNTELTANSGEQTTTKEKLLTLRNNFVKVVTYPFFWLIVVYAVFSSGPYFDISGMWISPYLQHVLGYSRQESGNVSIMLSVGLIAGSLLIPPLSTFLRTRKWPCFVSSLIAAVVSLVFYLLSADKISEVLVYFLLFFIGAFTNALTSVCYPLVSEYFHPSIAGTAVGCSNIFTFLSSAVFQTISSSIIEKYGTVEGTTDVYTEKGYKQGLWLVCLVSFLVSMVAIAITKDMQKKKEEEEISQSREMEEESDQQSKQPEEEVKRPTKEDTGSDLEEV
ncbi:major facilitator superfamily transporter [Histomonas meleagridis]|uniref:major facilitator superfamily transporter n=1 Tax=Histomonas meleagridis TaxID=135588 RepID=UPI0035594346|nr:major facilitator superfamily transporter [Histomonas meleagridis]KAH0798191.1 major facilitator superfamily transporter [Histomonas meleagridis]